jgi:hypothetical protein
MSLMSLRLTTGVRITIRRQSLFIRFRLNEHMALMGQWFRLLLFFGHIAAPTYLGDTY